MSLHHVPTSDDAWADLIGPAVDATTEGLLVQDADGTVRASNYAARVILGRPEPHRDTTGTLRAPASRSRASASSTAQPLTTPVGSGRPSSRNPRGSK